MDCPVCNRIGNEACPICRGRNEWLLTECPNLIPADIRDLVLAAVEWRVWKVWPDGTRGFLMQPASLVEGMRLFWRFARA